MPSHYAHYRFGTQVISGMPPEVSRSIRRFRQLYDVGLHGPDFLFYHNIFYRDPIVELGSKVHNQTGQDFFTRVCKHLRLEPNEAAMAYLYGVLAHYCLDAACHPYVCALDAEGAAGHAEIETEFDRYLLTQDGKRPAHTFDCSPHMRLTRGECVTVADFYPPVTPAAVNRSVKSMASAVKFLASPPGFRRNLLEGSVRLTGDKFARHMMSRSPNPKCVHLNADLMDLYGQAQENYPRMTEALTAHMSHGAPLGELFEPTFNG